MMHRVQRSRLWSPLALAVALVVGGHTAPVLAQGAIGEAARQAREFDNRQSEQQRLRQLEELERSNRAPGGELPTPPTPSISAKGERCFKIGAIEVADAHLVAEPTIRATVSPWEGRCLGLTEINNVLKALTFLYVERGYVAARAYLRQQNLSKGKLAIAIVEGKLETIHLNGQADTSGVIATAFPGLTGAPVNLRDIEQGLDQINRLRSNNATVALAAGAAPGNSVLDVANKPGIPAHFTVGADNLGATVSGIYQSRTDLAFDNTFGINDLWQFGYQRSMNRSPVFFSDERPNGDTVNASMSIPYGYWTAGIDSNWSQYHSSVPGQFSTIGTSGNSLLISPYVSRVIYRDQISKTLLTGRLTWKDTQNDILGTRIEVASRTLSIANIELNHSRQLWGGQASVGIGYQQGLAVLGAFDDSTAPPGSPKGQFSKVTASLGYYRQFDAGALTPVFSTSVLGQWTPDRLFGSEQIAFGGYSTVRGVRDPILFTDNGILMRNEFSLLLPAPGRADIAAFLGRFEPYIALDVGNAVPNNDGSGGTVVGAAVGMRNRSGRIVFDVWYANLIVKPDLPAASLPPTGLAQGRISVSF